VGAQGAEGIVSTLIADDKAFTAIGAKPTRFAHAGRQFIDLTDRDSSMTQERLLKKAPVRRLAAQLAHVAADRSDAVFQAMLLGFVQHRQAEQVGNVLIGGAIAERGAQIDLAIGHETGA
jgi:hypothetical protein